MSWALVFLTEKCTASRVSLRACTLMSGGTTEIRAGTWLIHRVTGSNLEYMGLVLGNTPWLCFS